MDTDYFDHSEEKGAPDVEEANGELELAHSWAVKYSLQHRLYLFLPAWLNTPTFINSAINTSLVPTTSNGDNIQN